MIDFPYFPIYSLWFIVSSEGIYMFYLTESKLIQIVIGGVTEFFVFKKLNFLSSTPKQNKIKYKIYLRKKKHEKCHLILT